MKTYGLTGGIGMGKSTAAGLLRKRGIAVVDSDELAREVVEPGQPALAEIQREFGGEMLDADGRLRREELAGLVFASNEARRKLEAILHPEIRAAREKLLLKWRKEGRTAAVAVIPLLFETGASDRFDETICVACTPISQLQRLRARGWTDKQNGERLAAQMPSEKKMLLSDYVVWTEGGLDVLEEQFRRVIP